MKPKILIICTLSNATRSALALTRMNRLAEASSKVSHLLGKTRDGLELWETPRWR
jgi:hypothetical protein